MVYSISYDLKNPGYDYSSLIEAIKSYGTWWHQTPAVWLIVSNQSAAVIRDNLMKYLDRNDVLFVVALKREWAAVGFKSNEYSWLKSIPNENWDGID